jgi:hypothetical protein
MIDLPDLGTFAAHVGDEFHIGTDAGADDSTLRLVEVTPLPSHPNAPRAEPFSLVFSGERGVALRQRTYAIRHPELGAFELFLVPIGPDASGVPRYESIFN